MIYIPTPQLLLPEDISLNCLRNVQDYYVDQITLLIGSPMPNHVVNSLSINTFKSLLDSFLLDL